MSDYDNEDASLWGEWVEGLVAPELTDYATVEALAYATSPVDAAEWRATNYDTPTRAEWVEFLTAECFDGAEGLAAHFGISTDPRDYDEAFR